MIFQANLRFIRAPSHHLWWPDLCFRLHTGRPYAGNAYFCHCSHGDPRLWRRLWPKMFHDSLWIIGIAPDFCPELFTLQWMAPSRPTSDKWVYLNNFIRHITGSMFCRGPIIVVFQVQILRIIFRVMSLGPRYVRRSRGSKARGPWRA